MRQKLDLLSEAAEELTTILQVCCEAYDVDINEVKSRSRKRGGVMEAANGGTMPRVLLLCIGISIAIQQM